MVLEEESPEGRLQRYLASTERVLNELERLSAVLDTPVTMGQVTEAPERLAYRVCLRRQLEALHATLILGRSGLGHLAVGFVRPAYEELVWLGYLLCLEQDDSRRLLILLSKEEALRSVRDQLEYLGSDAMVSLGFPSNVLSEDFNTQSKRIMRDLSTRLRWPQKGRLPSISWVAEQSSDPDFCTFMHSASSRMVHFSASEIFRRAWSDTPGPQGGLRLSMPIYTHRRTSFALCWLPEILAQLVAVCMRLAARNNETAPPSTDVSSFGDALRSWRETVQREPIVTSAELNY